MTKGNVYPKSGRKLLEFTGEKGSIITPEKLDPTSHRGRKYPYTEVPAVFTVSLFNGRK